MFELTIPEPILEFFQTAGTRLTCNKNAHVFQEGERAETIYLIKSGLVQINKETEQAKELTIRICSSGNIIGDSLLFGKFTKHTTTAKALKSTELYVLNQQLLEDHLLAYPQLMLDYVQWVQTENVKQQSRLRDLLLHGKKGALYSTLIRLANTYGEFQKDASVVIRIRLTNTDLANLCGTSREMINRFLNDLRKQQIISTHGGQLIILNLNFLKQEIECDNCPLAICRID